MNSSELVRRLWQFCNVLRDDGLSYPDYVEQLTYLMFIKMAEDSGQPALPAYACWSSFSDLDPVEMRERYQDVLEYLSTQEGTLGVIFRNARCKIKDSSKLALLVTDLIGRVDWSRVSGDLKGDAYEGLLEKNARDTKSGAGQYFTPRALVDAIVECVAPLPGELVSDPACGTGGFLLAVQRYMESRGEHDGAEVQGVELVEEVARLAAMNMLLHGLASAESASPVAVRDSLALPAQAKSDVIITNPPFGIRGSVTYVGEDGLQLRSGSDLHLARPDFWVSTSNKQLNFVQHVCSSLRAGGRAAMVIPDNVLYEGGAAARVRKRLMEDFNLHTILRLPPGLFYATGVLANVIFFDKEVSLPGDRLCVYNLRGRGKFSVKTRPLARDDLEDFLDVYHDDRRNVDTAGEFWRGFDKESLSRGDYGLDLKWGPSEEAGTDASSKLASISRDIERDLRSALDLLVNPE